MWSGTLPVIIVCERSSPCRLNATKKPHVNSDPDPCHFLKARLKWTTWKFFLWWQKWPQKKFWNSGKYGRWKLSKTIWLVIAGQFNNDWWYLSASVCRNWKFANLKIHHQHWKVCRGSRDAYAPSRWQLFYFSNTVLMQTVSITTARLSRRVWVLNWPAFQMFHQLERFGGLWKIQQRNTIFLSQKSSSWFPRFPDFYRLIKEEGDVTQW